jgi:guanylate kinase
MGNFLLLCGPSGVGKSTIIRHLKEIDKRFIYISPDTTRELRENEIDKFHVTKDLLEKNQKAGLYAHVNKLWDSDISYATPVKPIIKALKDGNFPVLDWPVAMVESMSSLFPVFVAYVAPPSEAELKNRIGKDNRDVGGSRALSGLSELKELREGKYCSVINSLHFNENNESVRVAKEIYDAYLLNN